MGRRKQAEPVRGSLPGAAKLDGALPTRRTLMLRRRHANRSRRRNGREVLPDIRPGGCGGCMGLGETPAGSRCSECKGAG